MAEDRGTRGGQGGRRGDPQAPSPPAALDIVRRGILLAEEKYLVEPGASLGTWFARVQEPIAVGSRVTLQRIGEGRRLAEADIAAEQLGLQADIGAEAIRAAAQLAPGGPSPGARDAVLAVVAQSGPVRSVASLFDVLVALACCSAALEPLAAGLREGDLPMGPPTDGDPVSACLIEVSVHAYAVIDALC
jgi:hypothetical protein